LPSNHPSGVTTSGDVLKGILENSPYHHPQEEALRYQSISFREKLKWRKRKEENRIKGRNGKNEEKIEIEG
jgi:hypothetical protein